MLNGNVGQRNDTLPANFNLRFPGQQFKGETGLHYNHHCYYDPYLTVGFLQMSGGLFPGQGMAMKMDTGMKSDIIKIQKTASAFQIELAKD